MNEAPTQGARRGGAGAATLARLFERPLPYSIEAEMAVLGSLILDPMVTPEVVSIIGGPDDFHDERHSAIFRVLLEVYDANPHADLVSIQDALRARGDLQRAGGDEYLLSLAQAVPSAASAPHYARLVSDKARLRRLIAAADQMIYDALHSGQFGPDGAREVLDAAEQRVFEIAQEDQKSDPQRLEDLLQIEIRRIEAAEGKGITGLPTGYPDLDKLLHGLQPGEMVIVAARPSMGKTALALNLAEQVARGGCTRHSRPLGAEAPVGVFSLEMTKAAVTQRLLSAFSGIDSQRLRAGDRLDADELATLKEMGDELKRVPILVDDTAGLTVMALRARARRMATQHNVRCIMVDYLQLLTAPGSSRESRQVEVSAISRGIKGLARELNIPVICLSQLNRASEQREGNRPRMSDLRESGSIEQDADVVMLLHREEYYHQGDPEWAENNPDKAGLAELIVAKQRNGPTGAVRLTWDARTTRFHSRDDSYATGSPGGFGSEVEWKRPAQRGGAGHGGAFASGRTTGPARDFRDGGGPEHGDDETPG